MSGHPQGGQYDDGYNHHQEGNTDSYYQDEHNQAYYDNNGAYAEGHGHQQGGDGYYDES
jgi:1,3-beta-glucan synthase